ncbi:MAG: hypothetical protein ACE5K4_12015 [Candidatus Hydrothermarchaeota archaeon]
MTQETALRTLWQKTKLCHNKLEKNIVENYINFLRQVAIHYLKKKKRVFFKENRIVHWGEWNFGSLLIQGSEDVSDVFGDHISEIRFEPEVDKFTKKEDYIEVHPENIDIIHYQVDEL